MCTHDRRLAPSWRGERLASPGGLDFRPSLCDPDPGWLQLLSEYEFFLSCLFLFFSFLHLCDGRVTVGGSRSSPEEPLQIRENLLDGSASVVLRRLLPGP